MDKVKKFLELYVQWLALGLAVAFLGWTVYSFVFTEPVSVDSPSGAKVAPSGVAKMVNDGAAEQLDTALKAPANPGPMGPSPDLVVNAQNSFKDTPQNVALVMPAGSFPLVPPLDIAAADTQPLQAPQQVMVTALPVCPAMGAPVVSSGHSNVDDIAGQPKDVNWNTGEAIFPCGAVAKAFKDAKLREMSFNISILRVQMQRQEKLPDGTYGSSEDIPPVDTTMKVLPSNSPPAPLEEQDAYKAWAQEPANVALICQPPFLKWVQGDVWYEPGTPNPNQVNVAVIDDGFDPAHPELFRGDVTKLTPHDLELYNAYLAKKAKIDAGHRGTQGRTNPTPVMPEGTNGGTNGSRGTNGGTSGGTGGTNGRSRSRLASDPQRNTPGDMLMPPGGATGGTARQPGMMSTQGTPGPANTAAASATLPQGAFNPSQQADIRVWAHDISAVAGKTYQYRMRYIISNPLARSHNLCNPPSLADVFSIEGEWSDWSAPISVESNTSFYAVNKQKGVRFDIFKWKNGIWQMQSVDANIGDVIGNVDATSKTDFNTGWTIVDIRPDARNENNCTIVLVSDNGTIKKKDLNLDQRSEEYRRLHDEAVNAKPPGAAVGAGTPPPNG